MSHPLISICIPAYKRIDFLKRLLDSVSVQTFTDFEVVVTDDSPDGSVRALCEEYAGRLPLSYFRNEQALGSPENWNESIRRSVGQWIKLMHDDDWFAKADSLGVYAQAIEANPGITFIFSAYRDIFLDEDRQRDMFVSSWRYRAFLKNHTVLFGRNIIGPPSVVLYRKEPEIHFDRHVKWVVDIEFYIRYLQGKQPFYIDRILVYVGLGREQVTQDCFGLRPIEIPENFYLLNIVGVGNLKNIWVYDAWWRLMRNLEIRKPEDISGSGYTGNIPKVILSMVRWQNRVHRSLLNEGFFSKICMFLHYLSHYNSIPA